MTQTQHRYARSLELRLGHVGLDFTQYVFNRRHGLESHAVAGLKPRTARAIVVNQGPYLPIHLDFFSLHTRASLSGGAEAGKNGQNLRLLLADFRAQIPRAS